MECLLAKYYRRIAKAVLLTALGAPLFQFVCFGGDGNNGYYDPGYYYSPYAIDPDAVMYWADQWDEYIRE